MPPILDQIVASARAKLPALRARGQELERRAAAAGAPPSFRGALAAGTTVALVAEVKRRSPSAGVIRGDLDPVAYARKYAENGAAAISVLTEEAHFGGSLDDLERVSTALGVPTLRKDFILDELQLVEARAAGASAALLIVRILPPRRLRELLVFGQGLGLDLLVETHTAGEVDVALTAGADIVGVNSRDLDTFALDPEAAWKLLAELPTGPLAVAESAMHAVADVRKAAMAGADAVLVGSALSASGDPGPIVKEFSGVLRRAR